LFEDLPLFFSQKKRNEHQVLTRFSNVMKDISDPVFACSCSPARLKFLESLGKDSEGTLEGRTLSLDQVQVRN